MIITVASGKGGTGKTTVATSLALTLSGNGSVDAPEVRLLDCDVEEPNAALFVNPQWESCKPVGVFVPEVDPGTCNLCGKCGQVCVFHAIVVAGKRVLVFPEMCHGCGSCAAQCEPGAIREKMHEIGKVESGRTGSLRFARGVLNVGEAMPVPLIRELKAANLDGCKGTTTCVAILDAPPGTSCPVVQAMRGADVVVLVTEPTPFGLHDLKLAVDVARGELNLPVGVIVNRDSSGFAGVDEYCQAERLPIVMRIPLDRSIAQAIARGQPLVDAFPEYRPRFQQLYQDLSGLVHS